MMPDVNKTRTEINGQILKVLFRKEDFAIATFVTEDGEEIKIKGSLYGVGKSEKLKIKGIWMTHPQYGDQFEVEQWERPIPKTKDQAIAFLASSLVKGCGEKQAVNIVEKLGDNAIEIINRDKKDALTGIKGIGSKRSNQIAESVVSNFEIQKIINQLLEYGIDAAIAMKAYKEFESDTVQVLKENPYQLTKLKLLDFNKADDIAQKMGIMPTSTFRIDACLEYVLKKMCFSKGHTYVIDEALFREVDLALNHHAIKEDVVSMEDIKDSIYRLEEQRIIIEGNAIYPKFLFKSEDTLASNISRMTINEDDKDLSSLEATITKYQKKNGIILAEKQREAIRRLFCEQLLVLSGGPGTGKTTVIKTMLDIFEKEYPDASICLAAPTGRAAKKLSEVTKMEAQTIHRLIDFVPGLPPAFNEFNKLDCQLLIVDEFSMVDVSLANLLIDALEKDTKILFVGDIDQLPSVSPGNVLHDLIESGLPTVRLTEVFRQAQESQIVTNAHRINQGQSLVIDKEKEDFYFIEKENLEQIAKYIVLSVMRFMKLGYALSDILVLSPIKKGYAGTQVLNNLIREQINPSESHKNEINRGERTFRENDKVIQLKNNPNKRVFNGDIGIITKIGKEKNEAGNEIDVVVIDYGDRIIDYYKNELDEIELAYAITIHKSQGGEASIVIIPATRSHEIMLARNLMYTGLTRAKEKAVFIGTQDAMDMAIHNDKITERNSRLAGRITAYSEYRNRYNQATGSDAN